MPIPWKPLPRLSSWRRLALHTWPTPRDPTVYSSLELDVSDALPFLERLRLATGVRLTLTHLVVKALATAISRYPESNALVRRRWIYARQSVDIFVQVVSDGGEDLGGAKIVRADEKSIVDIGRELANRAERIRAHRDPEIETAKQTMNRLPGWLLGLTMKATELATFGLGLDLTRFGVSPDPFGSAMVSNVGTFGIDWALAPLVPFSRCPIVMLVGAVRPRPVVVDDQVVARPVLLVGVTFDHRVMDGAVAGRMSKVFCEIVERPADHLAQAAPELASQSPT